MTQDTSPSAARERSQTTDLTASGGGHTLMGRFMSATGQFLMATYGQFSCPPHGQFQMSIDTKVCCRPDPALLRCHVEVDSSCPRHRTTESHNDWTTIRASPEPTAWLGRILRQRYACYPNVGKIAFTDFFCFLRASGKGYLPHPESTRRYPSSHPRRSEVSQKNPANGVAIRTR